MPRAQMQGFGQERLLTAGEEKVLSRRIQALIRAQEAQAAAAARLERSVTEKEWAAECGLGSVRELRKTLKVRGGSTRMCHSVPWVALDCRFNAPCCRASAWQDASGAGQSRAQAFCSLAVYERISTL